MSRDGIIKKHGDHERRRVFPGVRGPAPQNKAHKRSEAAERLDVWRAMTPEQQLAALDKRLGVDKGAVSQRARIKAKLKVVQGNVVPQKSKR